MKVINRWPKDNMLANTLVSISTTINNNLSNQAKSSREKSYRAINADNLVNCISTSMVGYPHNVLSPG